MLRDILCVFLLLFYCQYTLRKKGGMYAAERTGRGTILKRMNGILGLSHQK